MHLLLSQSTLCQALSEHIYSKNLHPVSRWGGKMSGWSLSEHVGEAAYAKDKLQER